MKKVLAILLMMCLAVCFTACLEEDSSSPKKDSQKKDSQKIENDIPEIELPEVKFD